MECPGCGGTKHEHIKGQVYRCKACNGIHGTCYLGDSYEYVSPYMAKDEVPPERLRYYDLTCLCSGGRIERRHGWYDPSTRLIHQVG